MSKIYFNLKILGIKLMYSLKKKNFAQNSPWIQIKPKESMQFIVQWKHSLQIIQILKFLTVQVEMNFPQLLSKIINLFILKGNFKLMESFNLHYPVKRGHLNWNMKMMLPPPFSLITVLLQIKKIPVFHFHQIWILSGNSIDSSILGFI